LPANGQYVEVESEAQVLGGEAANTAAHLRRWNAEAKLLGNCLSVNADGILLAELLSRKDLRYDLHEVSTEFTPACDIYVTPDGERTMFGLGFSTMVAPPVESFEPESEGWFTTDANLGLIAEAYCRKACESGMRLYLMDLSPASELLAPNVFWQSSTRWIGTRGDIASNLSLVQSIADKTNASALLTDSGNGFVFATPGISAKSYSPFPRLITLDSTGAGDTFRAGMLFGLDQDWSMNQCFMFAAAAAEGPTKREVESHIAANPQVAKQYA
jgi:sugar/nucleoside kinase (ribokinase family)